MDYVLDAADGDRSRLLHEDSRKWSAATYHVHLQRRPNTIVKMSWRVYKSIERVMGGASGRGNDNQQTKKISATHRYTTLAEESACLSLSIGR